MPLNSIEYCVSLVGQVIIRNRSLILIFSAFGIVGRLYNRWWINRRLFLSKESLQGRTVLITGGNGGIGFEVAEDLLRRGELSSSLIDLSLR